MVDTTMEPVVPDQDVSGCVTVIVGRVFENDAEREMIRIAESIPSTIGPTWYSSTRTPGVVDENGNPLYLFADAITSDALIYYAQRARTLQTSSNSETVRVWLDYGASVSSPRLNSEVRSTVYLRLSYTEIHGALYSASTGFAAARQVDFDDAGNVVAVRLDGIDFPPVN
ncbi:MAG: hypothetical protein HZA51_05435 [Planctomycetes bacterium]|nr:hypothetical protein [Planctomycetota bacterium]